MGDPARLARTTVFAVAAVLLSACSLSDDDGEGTSVFEAKPGMCFQAPEKLEAQVDQLEEVPCDQPHDQEAYALVPYAPAAGEDGDAFPGEDTLATFADGVCAREFRDYVGIDYLDSRLYFTYLLPSPRSWEQDDRDVLCLATDAGKPLEGTVKGTKQ